MIQVTLYTRDDCQLCDDVKDLLQSLQPVVPHQLEEIDIDGDRELNKLYGLEIPVVKVGPYQLRPPITPQDLEIVLRAAAEREADLQSIQQARYDASLAGPVVVTRGDRFSYWLSRHYMLVINLFVLTYLGLPFLAPVLMAAGLTGPATGIYRVYGVVCHQFAFRSWFLFGEQAEYPRQAAGVGGLLTYGQATGLDEGDIFTARQFVGNSEIGYKVALCQRDVAIYGGILIFGLVFSLTGRRVKPLPWYIWVVVGILPIALDGTSQLLSQPPLNFLSYRESTPFLRSLTGFLFGFTTAWFGLPLVETTMVETRKYMEEKFRRAGLQQAGD
ncbi:MAG TPA: DUF2085 domain-containing protein [Anaerolineales bacterium]|nr:DUF2085 domain-containing protein [Anaerolineales bacterium]